MRAEANKKIILDAAVKLLAKEGLSVSLRKVAQLAEVSPGLIIHHFGSREELVDAAIQSCLDNLLERKKSFDSETWSSGLVGLFLEISEPELDLLRRVLVDDTSVTTDLFSSSMKHASIHLNKTKPELSRQEVKIQSAILAAQALGSVIMLPQLLKVVKPTDLTVLTDWAKSKSTESSHRSTRK